jgi:hypothetical protein
LRIAGASWQIFQPETLELVHRYSRGIPRIINLICEHALIVAYVEQVQQVTGAMVEGVAVELELETHPFLISSAAMGSAGGQSSRAYSSDGPNLITSFNGEIPGRQDR